ncbi:MAG: isoprenylcysteine carboxylmethyltransferase family protein [Acidobacteriaceae bacterium]|nr:isoprenylcysteine carboxylmethyltransferase family protein [Acidobacteriaceae bacterium]
MSDPRHLNPPHYWFPKPYADFVQRLRVTCGFLLIAAFLWLSHPLPSWLMAGLPVSILGLALRGWAAGHLAKNQQLATTGPYAYIRNPLYAGTLMVALGIVIASRSAWLALVFATVFLLIYLPSIELEEQHLRNLFSEYAPYASRVRRFLPGQKWRGPRALFSSSLYRQNQEYKALIGFFLAVLWLAWKCWLAETVR